MFDQPQEFCSLLALRAVVDLLNPVLAQGAPIAATVQRTVLLSRSGPDGCPSGGCATRTARRPPRARLHQREVKDMFYAISEDHLYAMRLDELYGLYAEAKRQTGFLRPCSQAYARAVAAIWRIGEADKAPSGSLKARISRPLGSLRSNRFTKAVIESSTSTTGWPVRIASALR